jgi:alpha-L-rhamnosidase
MLEGWNDMRLYDRHWKRGRLQMEGSSAGEWFFRDLGGIQPDLQHPGFSQFVLRPAGFERLEQVKAETSSSHGKILSAWVREGGTVQWWVTIPLGSVAELVLPWASIEPGSLRIDGGNIPIPAQGSITLAPGNHHLRWNIFTSQ